MYLRTEYLISPTPISGVCGPDGLKGMFYATWSLFRVTAFGDWRYWDGNFLRHVGRSARRRECGSTPNYEFCRCILR
jgi:hypothetical protein